MKKFLIAAGIIVVAGIAIAVAFSMHKKPVVIGCTMEAKICPDGSAVGRTGPNCAFAACPTAE